MCLHTHVGVGIPPPPKKGKGKMKPKSHVERGRRIGSVHTHRNVLEKNKKPSPREITRSHGRIHTHHGLVYTAASVSTMKHTDFVL